MSLSADERARAIAWMSGSDTGSSSKAVSVEHCRDDVTCGSCPCCCDCDECEEALVLLGVVRASLRHGEPLGDGVGWCPGCAEWVVRPKPTTGLDLCECGDGLWVSPTIPGRAKDGAS